MDSRTAARVLGGLAAIVGLVVLGPITSAQVAPRAPVGARFGTVFVQCPGDNDGDAVPDVPVAGLGLSGAEGGMIPAGSYMFQDVDYDLQIRYYRTKTQTSGGFSLANGDTRIHCESLTAGDGFITVADRHNPTQEGFPDGNMFILGFSKVTGTPASEIMHTGFLSANFPAPTLRLKEGEEFYLSLTNVGMVMRPDLFDPHTVHFHGFPQAASVFDGVPESSLSTTMGSSFTYFYQLMDPGTYMYHCHQEATEHMQMGMLGNLYVEPKQNELGCNTKVDGTPICHAAGTDDIAGYAYNDDVKTSDPASTYYNVEYPIQIGSFDPNFHNQEQFIQPLPFASMRDKYPMLNGRGYPDTTSKDPIVTDTTVYGPKPSQPVSSLIELHQGQRALLRISNLAVTRFYTLASQLPLRIVGRSAKLLRGPAPTFADLSFKSNSVTLGGGESADAILDTTGVPPGTYMLYTTNLNYLTNNTEPNDTFGGMATEIRIQ